MWGVSTPRRPIFLSHRLAKFCFIHLNPQPRAVRHLGNIAADRKRFRENVGSKKLRGIQRGRLIKTKRTKQGQGSRQRNIRVGQSAAKPKESGIQREPICRLADARPPQRETLIVRPSIIFRRMNSSASTGEMTPSSMITQDPPLVRRSLRPTAFSARVSASTLGISPVVAQCSTSNSEYLAWLQSDCRRSKLYLVTVIRCEGERE